MASYRIAAGLTSTLEISEASVESGLDLRIGVAHVAAAVAKLTLQLGGNS